MNNERLTEGPTRHSGLVSPRELSGVRCRKSEMRWTRKSLSLRLANRKFILFLVLMETGHGSTLLLSAFSTMDT